MTESQLIQKLYEAGAPDHAIGRVLGITRMRAVTWRKKNNKPAQKDWRKWTGFTGSRYWWENQNKNIVEKILKEKEK